MVLVQRGAGVEMASRRTSTRRSRGARRRHRVVALVALASTAAGVTWGGASNAAPASAPPGIRTSFGVNTLAANSNVMGGQIVFDWQQIEPQKGMFCWDNPRTATTGCGTPRSNASRGLKAQLAYFKSIGKETTVQVNSSRKPLWMYAKGTGVERCGTQQAQLGASTGSIDIPMYWRANGALNQNYFAMMSAMLTSLARAISTSPNQDVVSGVRASPNLVGTEFRVADPRAVTIGGPITLSNPRCSAQSAWTYKVANQAYASVMTMNYNLFEKAGIRPILRQVAFTNLAASNLDPRRYLTSQPGVIQPWYFATSSSPDTLIETKDPFDYAWARTGQAVAYDEAVAPSDAFADPVSWNYWNALTNLDRGTSYIAMFAQDIARAQTDPEYAAAYEFANRYAAMNSPASVAQSPGAWIALAPNPGEITDAPTRSLTKGDLGMFMTEDPLDGSVERDSLGVAATRCPNDGPNKVCAGINMLGSPTQRFGRWARATAGPDHPSILLSLDSAFTNTLPEGGTVAAYVTYLDCGAGTWKLDWGGGTSVSYTKSGSADCASSSDQWITAGPIAVPVDAITRSVSGNDFGLTTDGGDTTFHMLEIRRSLPQ